MILMDSREESSTTTNGAVGEDVDDEQKEPPMDDVEENDDEDTAVPASASATTKPRKVQRKYKKAPGAPKRFRSAFILFSQFKHKEIQAMLAERGDSEKTTSVAKMVSEAWRTMGQNERDKWEEKASLDRERFEKEKMRYRGPWTVPIGHRKSKDPTAPKRPASAFLSFSNSRRAAAKREHKHCSNAEISRILSNMWKEAPEDVKKEYTDRESAAREEYKKKMAEWRIENEKTKKKKKDPLELYQEHEEERKRKGIASDEEDGYDYDSEHDEVRWKKGKRSRREEIQERKDCDASHRAAGPPGRILPGGSRLNDLVQAFGGTANSAKAQLVAPHMLVQAPMITPYPGMNPMVLAPTSLTMQQLHDSRALPTFTNVSMLQNGLPLYQGSLPGLTPAAATGNFGGLNRQPGAGATQPLYPNYMYQSQLQPRRGAASALGQPNQATDGTAEQRREQEFVLQLLARRQSEDKQRSQSRPEPPV